MTNKIISAYIWFDYTKPSGSSNSKLVFVGSTTYNDAVEVIDKVTKEDMMNNQNFKFFRHDVTLTITLQNIKTSEVLYKRTI